MEDHQFIDITGQVAMVSVRVRPSDLPDDQDRQKYVYLVAKSDDQRLSFVNETVILMDRNAGFVFVQTDKPIYTPDQQGKTLWFLRQSSGKTPLAAAMFS